MNHFDRKPLQKACLGRPVGRTTFGYYLALLVIGFLALASFAVLIVQIKSHERFATLIEMSGRERILSQRAALFSLRLTQEADADHRREFRAVVQRAIDDMLRLQRGLEDGDAVLGLDGHPGAEVERLYRQLPNQLHARTARYAETERNLLARAGDGRLDSRSPELAEVLRDVSGKLLTALEDVVAAYQRADKRFTQRVEAIEIVVILLLLATLVIDVKFIFRPLARSLFRETRAQIESRRVLDAVLATVGEAIITADADNVIQHANCEAERVWQRPAAQLIGRTINSLVVPGRDLESSAWRAVFPPGERVETIGIRHNDEHFPLELRLSETRLDCADSVSAGLATDSRYFFTVSARDISERVEAARQLDSARDAALESIRFKGEFVANISHEIRTPMNGILGMVELLRNTSLSHEQRELVETIHGSGDALLSIINDILDFSKMEAGKMSLETIGFDLRQLVESTAEMLAGRALQKHLELIAYIAPGTPTRLLGDPCRLRQVLLNLLGNAIKFTKVGEVVVRVDTLQAGPEKTILRFSVRDTGVGIEPAARDRLFHAFTQADESIARKFGGTGLGLTICRQLVELMNGRIDFEDAPGHGTIFWFNAEFAVRPESESLGISAVDNPPLSIDPLRNKRVLVADDNATLRALVCERLRAWGMIADEAANGSQTLALMRQHDLTGAPYDFALLDLNLGSIDGFTLAWAINNQHRLARARLILVTSLGLESDRNSYHQVGILGSVTKPIKHDALLRTLLQALEYEPDAPEAALLPLPVSLPSGRAASLKLHEFSTGRVLLAEDNLINRKLTLRQLANLGYHADAVENGLEALAALDAHEYDVVLLDMFMPEMDGYQAAMTIRQHEADSGRGHQILIAITASNLNGDRERCLAAGVDDFLSKPVRQQELARMLTQWMPADLEVAGSPI